jgi:hypothetical protein
LGIDLAECQFLKISFVVIEPESALERVRQITYHIFLGDRDLRVGDGKRARKEDPLNF